MPIPFTCPHCSVHTSVGEPYAGQSGPCAACGKMITVPPPGGASIAPTAAARSLAGPVSVMICVAALGALLVCGGLAFWLIPVAKIQDRQAACANNLKYIGLGMLDYHDTYNCFPAAVLTDEHDSPVRSWRVALLPFVEQGALYDRYDFDEPWDGPNNSLLLGDFPGWYRCPGDGLSGPTDTSYVMIVGEGTMGGEPREEVSCDDVMDGTSNTILILVIEVAGAGIPWTEPRDITVEEAVTLITDPEASQFEQAHSGGVNVLLADGSVLLLPTSMDRRLLRAMLTRADGQALPPNP